MKKIFLIPLTIALAACMAKNGETQQAFQRFKQTSHTLIEPDNNNYWKNNIRNYKTYPINFYTDNNRPYDDYEQKKTVNLREYARNTAVSARAGQRMVDSETYTVTESSNKNSYTPSSGGTIYKTNSEMHIAENQVLSPIGEIKVENAYYLLFSPEQDGRLFLIDSSGQVLPKMGYLDGKNIILSGEVVTLSPKGLRLNPASPSTVNSNPQKHFEIKYEGMNSTNMSFIYTNYENGTMQRFTYPADRKVIDINGIKFSILRVEPDHIDYMISD